VSFRNRLTFFFILLVILPVLALTLVGILIVRGSEREQSDAVLERAKTAAAGLYGESRERARTVAGSVATDEQLLAVHPEGHVEFIRKVADAGGGELVGYALLFAHWSGEYGGELLLLDELYVVPELRSRGVGADLMAWVEAYARRTGRVGITFVVVGQNTHARRFYERIGYERLDVSVYDKRLG